MAGFGKADIGLIRATAGAEAGQHIDENLMTGSVIGTAISGFLESMKAQQAATQARNAEIRKEIGDKLAISEGKLHPNLMLLNQKSYEQKTKDIASVTGNNYESKSTRASHYNEQEQIVNQSDHMQGGLNAILDPNFVMSPGSTQDTEDAVLAIQNNPGALQFHNKQNQDGTSSIEVAAPKESKPEKTKEIEFLLQAEVDGSIDSDGQVILDVYKSREEKYNKHIKKPDTDSEGNWNTDKYHVYNGNNLPVGENMKNKTGLLTVWNTNISQVDSSEQLAKNKPASDYAAEITSAFDKQGKDAFDLSPKAMQDIIYGDISDDGIDNSFAEIFVGGVNKDKPELEKFMYTNEDGTYIDWDLKSLGVEDKDILNYDKDGDGKFTWSDEKDSEWVGLPPEYKEKLLDKWLRNEDANGNSRPGKRVDWIKSRYANFMGEVMKDARTQKQKDHFSGLGRYFDNGDDNSNPVFKTSDKAYSHKAVTYQKTLLNNAFPENLVKDGVSLGRDVSGGDQRTSSKDSPALLKAQTNLELSFSSKFSVDGTTLTVTHSGDPYETETFDFAGDIDPAFPDKPRLEYKRLMQFLSEEDISRNDEIAIDDLGNSTNDQNWKNLQSQEFDNYPANRIDQEFTAGQYEEFELDGQLIRDQNIKIIGYNPEDGTYKVQVNGGNSGSVDLVLKK